MDASPSQFSDGDVLYGATMKKTILELRNIQKQFHGNDVLRDIRLTLKEGEILGLLGVNGSGKSTLLNIISGNPVIEETGSYGGEILLEGKPIKLSSVMDSQRHGIAMVHQEFNLMEDLTVWENICLSRQAIRSPKELRRSLARIDSRKFKTEARLVLGRLGVTLDPEARVADLPVNEKQFVEIARCISAEHIRVLMLDEPTATLNSGDAGLLLHYLKNLAQTGMAIMFISHRIEEVIQISDQVLVLRDGRNVFCSHRREEFRAELLSEKMIGSQYHFSGRRRPPRGPRQNVILHYENFSVHRPLEPIHDLDLDIYEGETVGLTGLNGHGQNALAFGTMGIDPCDGILQFFEDGEAYSLGSPAQAIRRGMTFVTEDRRKNGLLMDFSVEQNINFLRENFTRELDLIHLSNAFRFRDPRRSHRSAMQIIDSCGIVCCSPAQRVRELSGGNQQKVALARAMLLRPRVLFINEPTRGIDIRSKDAVLGLLEKLNEEEHTTIVLASSDLEELKRVCDRICIFYEGRLEQILHCTADARMAAAEGNE